MVLLVELLILYYSITILTKILLWSALGAHVGFFVLSDLSDSSNCQNKLYINYI